MSATYAPFVTEVIRSMVDQPEAVVVDEQEENGSRTFYVSVAQEDVGKVIGKSGRVVSAIRCVVSAIASKSRERAYVRVVTDDRP